MIRFAHCRRDRQLVCMVRTYASYTQYCLYAPCDTIYGYFHITFAMCYFCQPIECRIGFIFVILRKKNIVLPECVELMVNDNSSRMIESWEDIIQHDPCYVCINALVAGRSIRFLNLLYCFIPMSTICAWDKLDLPHEWNCIHSNWNTHCTH